MTQNLSQEQQRLSSKRRIAILYFFFYVYLSSMNSFFPAYYHHELSVSEELVGFLFGLSPIMTLLVAPGWAFLADYFEGGRKSVLMITFTITTVADLSLLYYDSTKHDVRTLILLRIWSAIFYAPVKGLMDSFAISYLSQFSSTASSDHGRSARLWGEISMGLTSSITGRIIFASSKPKFGFAFALRGMAYIPCMICLCTMKQMKACEKPSSQTSRTLAHEETALSTIHNEMHRTCITQQPKIVVNGVLSSSNPDSCKDTAVLSSVSQAHLNLSPLRNRSNGLASKKNIIASSEINNRAVHFFKAVFFFCLVFLNGLVNRFMETFAYVCIRQMSVRSQSQDQHIPSSHHFLVHSLVSLDSGTVVALCRLSVSFAGTIMYYYSPTIVRSVPINRLSLLSLFFCGVCCTLYGSSSPYAIVSAILAEAIRGGMYAILWSGCTYHVQSSQFANSLFRDDSSTSTEVSHTSTLQTILEAVYKGFGHSLGGICGGKLVKYVGSLPQSFRFVGEGVLTLSLGLGLFNELFGYASVINGYHQNRSRLLKDKTL